MSLSFSWLYRHALLLRTVLSHACIGLVAILLLSTQARALSMSDIVIRPHFDAGNEMTAFDEWYVASGVKVNVTPEWQWYIANQVSNPGFAESTYRSNEINSGNNHSVVSGVSYQWSENLRLESRIRRESHDQIQQSSIAFGSALSLNRIFALKAGMNVQTNSQPNNPQTDVQFGLGLGANF